MAHDNLIGSTQNTYSCFFSCLISLLFIFFFASHFDWCWCFCCVGAATNENQFSWFEFNCCRYYCRLKEANSAHRDEMIYRVWYARTWFVSHRRFAAERTHAFAFSLMRVIINSWPAASASTMCSFMIRRTSVGEMKSVSPRRPILTEQWPEKHQKDLRNDACTTHMDRSVGNRRKDTESERAEYSLC